MEDMTPQRYRSCQPIAFRDRRRSCDHAPPNSWRTRVGRVPGARLAVAFTILAACDGTGPGAVPLRFGQSGELHIAVETPLHLGQGSLHQEVVWKSDGSWIIHEEIRYRDRLGESDRRRNPGLPIRFQASYASVIQIINDNPNLRLLDVDQLEVVSCPEGTSRVTLEVVDTRQNQRRLWARCAFGSIASMTTAGSGPDVTAARVIQVVLIIRDNTVGEDFRSAYIGSLPFATLDKGVETSWPDDRPLVFRGDTDDEMARAESLWDEFWKSHHDDPAAASPEVDWTSEMTLAGFIGEREEVGDSVEIRGIVTVASGTKVELYERVPGHFCAPARRIVRPYHIVVAPKAHPPVFYSELKRDSIACPSF